MRSWTVQVVNMFDFCCMEPGEGFLQTNNESAKCQLWLLWLSPEMVVTFGDHWTQVSLTYVVRRHIGLDFPRLLVGASKPRCCWWSIDHKLWIISGQLFIKIIWNDFKKSSFIKFQSDHDIEFWVISEQAVSMTWPMTPPTSHSCEPVHLGNTSLVSWEFCLRGCHQSVRQLAGQLWLGVRSSKSWSFWVWNCLKLLFECCYHSTFFCSWFPLLFLLLLVWFVVCPTIVHQGLGFLFWSCTITSTALEEPKPPIWDKDQAGQQSWEVVSSQMESRSSKSLRVHRIFCTARVGGLLYK